MKIWSICWLSILRFTFTYAIAGESPAPAHDGSKDFDFLIGNWKAHVRRLPDRLVGSNNWIDYNGISNHKKLLDTNANFEEFEVDNPDKHLHIKGQTLRIYNPDSHQWGYLPSRFRQRFAQPATGGGRVPWQSRRVFRSGTT